MFFEVYWLSFRPYVTYEVYEILLLIKEKY